MESLRRDFLTIGFKRPSCLGILDPRHVLIRFDIERDYHRCRLHGLWSFKGCVMRVLKWTPIFCVATESLIVPLWIQLPHLPIHLSGKGSLFSIARLLGNPLRLIHLQQHFQGLVWQGFAWTLISCSLDRTKYGLTMDQQNLEKHRI